MSLMAVRFHRYFTMTTMNFIPIHRTVIDSCLFRPKWWIQRPAERVEHHTNITISTAILLIKSTNWPETTEQALIS